jgi:hypothetical protein
MGKKGYVIQKLGYEYNDETYYRPEEGGGNPVIVLTDEVAAKKKFMELEIEAWKNEHIGHYGYDLSDVAIDSGEFERALEAIGLDTDDWWDMKIPANATDDQIKRLIKASRVRFHEVVEVDMEETPEISDDEIGPSDSILDTQDALAKGKRGIFDSVNQFTNPSVTPTQVPDNVSIEDIKAVVQETNDDFLSIKEEMKRLRDEARGKVKNFFLKGMNKIFEMYPEVKSVSWTQYTPYFNDGEECTFGAHTDYFSVNSYTDYNDEGEEGTINVLDYDYNNGRQYKYHKGKEIHDAIQSFLDQLDDDDYKTMFGDHAEVIVRKDEITVEEYEHD